MNVICLLEELEERCEALNADAANARDAAETVRLLVAFLASDKWWSGGAAGKQDDAAATISTLRKQLECLRNALGVLIFRRNANRTIMKALEETIARKEKKKEYLLCKSLRGERV